MGSFYKEKHYQVFSSKLSSCPSFLLLPIITQIITRPENHR
jgi:hypothetical protein